MFDCRNSYTMNSLQQYLCRLFVIGFGVLTGLAHAEVQTALIAPQSEAIQPMTTQGHQKAAQDLESLVIQWAAAKASTAMDQVRMLPLDPRLQVKACAQPLVLDAPFTSIETVRVRCEQPTWQLYVRVSFQEPVSRPLVAQEPSTLPEPKRKVLVAAASLPRGTLLTPDLVKLTELDAYLPGPQALERLVDIQHMELAREIRAGVPIRGFDVRPVVLVKRGQNVILQIGQSPGFVISARLEALQDGRMGEQIRLKNGESGRTLSGVVVGKNAVRGL